MLGEDVWSFMVSLFKAKRYRPNYSLYSVGFIFSEEFESLVRYFNSGDTIELQVNITENSLARHIRTLTWYHNESEVRNSPRISVQNNGRELTVHNALSTDAGTYRVEVSSLDFVSSSLCDGAWLHFLRNHAAYAPVTFTVWELQQPNGKRTIQLNC